MLDKEKALSLAKNAFSTSDTYFNNSVRNTMERDIRQVQGLHPSGSKYYSDHYKGRSKLFRPKTRTALRQAEATCASAFFSTQDIVSISAEDEKNDMQAASAAINQQLLNYRLSKSVNWFQILVGAYQEAHTVGVVASLQTWKYDEENGIDKPDVQLIPPENVRIDPAANWTDPVNSSPYVIILLPMYVYEIEARKDWIKLDRAKIRAAGSRTSDSIRLQRENGMTDSKEQTSEINEFSIVWVHLNFIRQGGKDYCFYTLADQELLSEPKLTKDAFPHLRNGDRPVVMGKGTLEAHKIYSTSKTSMSRDIQAEINEVANQRIDNVKFAMNKRYFVNRNRNVDIRSLVRNVPSGVTLMDNIDTDVRIVETNDVTSSAYAEQDRLNSDFDDIAGAFSGSSVASNRKLNETVGGMQMLSNNANQIGEYDLKVFTETWVEPVLRQMILMEQTYETDEMILALAGDKAKLYQRFGMDVVTDELLMQEVTLSVNVGTGSTNTFNQLERFVYGLREIQALLGESAFSRLKSGEVIKEIFGKIGYKDGGRFYIEEGDNPEVDDLISQIEQLKSMLAQKENPEMVAAKISDINAKTTLSKAQAVKVGVEAVYSAMQTGASIAQNPLIAPVGDKVMEASGYQRPNGGQDPNIPITNAPTTQANGDINTVTQNTSPLEPPVPQSSMQGIETFKPNDGAQV
jgi:hypothetical protein